MAPRPTPPLWIFGYGSLIFRPDFPSSARIVGRVNGFARRFWQASEDHRGRPGAPGRVVTLVEDCKASCTGVAFLVTPGHEERVLAQLEVREQGGYSLLQQDFEALRPLRGKAREGSQHGAAQAPVQFLQERASTRDASTRDASTRDASTRDASTRDDDPALVAPTRREGPPKQAWIYIGTTDNPLYVGPEAEEKSARIIAHAEGPSGRNVDYLRKLRTALHELGSPDPHVERLWSEVERVLQR